MEGKTFDLYQLENQKNKLKQDKIEAKKQLDSQILELVQKYGKSKWKRIAAELNCPEKVSYIRDRYHNNILGNHSTRMFSTEENDIIMNFIEQNGTKWRLLVKLINDCTQRQIKNYFHSSLKRKYFFDFPQNNKKYPRVLGLIISSSYGLSKNEIKFLEKLNTSLSKRKKHQNINKKKNEKTIKLKMQQDSEIISKKIKVEINEVGHNYAEENQPVTNLLQKNNLQVEQPQIDTEIIKDQKINASSLKEYPKENTILRSLELHPFEPQQIQQIQQIPHPNFLNFQQYNEILQQQNHFLLYKINEQLSYFNQVYSIPPLYNINPAILQYSQIQNNMKNQLFAQKYIENSYAYLSQQYNKNYMEKQLIEQKNQNDQNLGKQQIHVKIE